MAVYCFECGVEVPDPRKIVRSGRVFCSEAHARRSIRQTAAAPQIKQAAPPAAAPKVTTQTPVTPTPAPAAQAGAASPPAASPTTPKKP